MILHFFYRQGYKWLKWEAFRHNIHCQLLIIQDRELFLIIPFRPADIDLLNDGDLVHVEKDPRAVTDEEGGHDGHQEDAQVVLLDPTATPPSLPDHEPDLVIQEGDGDKGGHAQHHKPGKQ